MFLIDEVHASLQPVAPPCQEAHASSLGLSPPDLERSGSGFVSVYVRFIFGIFSVYYSVLSSFLVYLHDLMLCFLDVINIILVV